MHLRDLKTSGHAPSLFSAFLHFDISFMVWVIFGALMPFIASDPTLTGPNLLVTPTSAASAGRFTLLVKGPQTVAENPALKADQPRNVYNVIIKPGNAAQATRAGVKPVERFTLDNRDPSTLAALNAKSRLIRVALAPGANANPNEAVLPLVQGRARSDGGGLQPLVVANGYSAALKLTLVGVPLLAAGFWRILLGVLVDRFNSRRVGIVSLAVTLLPLAAGWRFGDTYHSLLGIGFFLGLAGASFAVSLPLASRWYPPHLQGVAMGIAGMGNSGTLMATIFAPMLARAFGWHAVMGLLMAPVAATLAVFCLLAKDPPSSARASGMMNYLRLLGQADSWWFCGLYFVTFGGFVGLSSFFNTFFVDQYDAPRAAVGLWTWPFILAGSLARPFGGYLSDRLGGVRMLMLLYGVVAAAAAGVGLCLRVMPMTCALLLVMMTCLGMGNGAVFQLVPQRFRKQIGAMTGLVGAAGGVGGYYLNFALGHLHDSTGTYASGFLAFAVIAGVALIGLRIVSPRWTRAWLGAGGVAVVNPVATAAPDGPNSRELGCAAAD